MSEITNKIDKDNIEVIRETTLNFTKKEIQETIIHLAASIAELTADKEKWESYITVLEK